MAPAMPPSSQTQARPIRRELSLAEIARTLTPVFASCTHLPLRAEVSPSSSTTGPARLDDAQPPPSRFHETRRRRMRRTWPPNQ